MTHSAEKDATAPSDLGWWTISGSEFLRALRLVAEGNDPDAVYAEFYANNDHEHHGGSDA